MAAPIRYDASGRIFPSGPPVPLFKPPVREVLQSISRQQYAVADHGRRFLVSAELGREVTSPITLLINHSP